LFSPARTVERSRRIPSLRNRFSLRDRLSRLRFQVCAPKRTRTTFTFGTWNGTGQLEIATMCPNKQIESARVCVPDPQRRRAFDAGSTGALGGKEAEGMADIVAFERSYGPSLVSQQIYVRSSASTPRYGAMSLLWASIPPQRVIKSHARSGVSHRQPSRRAISKAEQNAAAFPFTASSTFARRSAGG
jgi:hypothetical protein